MTTSERFDAVRAALRQLDGSWSTASEVRSALPLDAWRHTSVDTEIHTLRQLDRVECRRRRGHFVTEYRLSERERRLMDAERAVDGVFTGWTVEDMAS